MKARKMQVSPIVIPSNMYDALKELKKHEKNADYFAKKYKDCIKLIKALSRLERVEQKYYIDLFKFYLYLEHYEVLINEKEKYEINNYVINNYSNVQVIDMSTVRPKPCVVDWNSIVAFYENDTQNKYLGDVISMNRNCTKVTVHLRFPITSEVRSKKFTLRFNGSTWPMRCCFHALMSNTVPLDIIYPQVKPGYVLSTNDIAWINAGITKNDKQMQVVRNILNKTAYPAPYIVFGPPGTGKTATLVETLCQILKSRPTDNILVCSLSNNAVDEITERLLKTECVPAHLICRLYASTKTWEDVRESIIPCAYFDKNIVFASLRRIRIITATLVTCIKLAMNLKGYFSYIFIDEASQATEPEMLIPFMLLKENVNTQVVIAGDPYQLGPVVFSKYAQNILGKSMIERLMNDCQPYKKDSRGKYNPKYITKLVENYRSHKDILHVPNQLFYNNELECRAGAEVRMALNWSTLPQKMFPLIFHAVLGTETRTPKKSVFNMAEAEMVVTYVKSLIGADFERHKITENDIGIITPFRGQQFEITKMLSTHNWKNIFVGTTELFQGQERNIIIISLVRSEVFCHSGVKHIGFLSHPKRFNVAVTRAKALLIIIGNPSIINISEEWKTLYSYCLQNGACYGDIPPTLQSLMKSPELQRSCNTDLNANKQKTVDKLKTAEVVEENSAKEDTAFNELINAMKLLTLSN